MQVSFWSTAYATLARMRKKTCSADWTLLFEGFALEPVLQPAFTNTILLMFLKMFIAVCLPLPHSIVISLEMK